MKAALEYIDETCELSNLLLPLAMFFEPISILRTYRLIGECSAVADCLLFFSNDLLPIVGEFSRLTLISSSAWSPPIEL